MSTEFAPQTAIVDLTSSTPSPATEVETPIVEEVVESATTEVVTETPETGSEPQVTEEAKGAEKRIKQLVAQKHEAEQRIAILEGMISQANTQQIATVPDKQPVEPQLDDFPSYSEWERANGKFLIESAKYETAQMIKQSQESFRTQQQESLFQARLSLAAAEDPAVLPAYNDSTLPISPTVGSMIKESTIGPQMLKYLSENRDVAQKLSNMPPILAAMEFGKLAYQVSITPAPIAPEIKHVSAAPAPIKTVAPQGRVTVRDEDLPIEEFMKRRNMKQYKKA